MSIPGLGWAPMKGTFQLGVKTLKIPMSLHRASREKLCAEMKKAGVEDGVVLLEGGKQLNQYDTDTEPVFRQDSWFNFLFGVKESEFFGAVDIATAECTLFMPRLPDVYRIWCGEIHPPAHFKDMYDVDAVVYADEIDGWLTARVAEAAASPTFKVHVLEGVNSDSGLSATPANFGASVDLKAQGRLSNVELFPALTTARVTKSPRELECMWYSAWVASTAHVEVMRAAAPGMMEYELEARFMYEIYAKGGCRKTAYTSICACGPNPAVLHYGHAGAPNDRIISEGDLGLLDMGAEYHGYVSDITCSYPIRSSPLGPANYFSDSQSIVFEGVSNAVMAVYDIVRPGTLWTDCHLAAGREVLKAMQKLGCVRADADIEAALEDDVAAVFMPHGLGHLIGCDTHDVGGYLNGTPSRSTRPGLKSLRTARALEEGMCLTNEPGCYFISPLLDEALACPTKSKYLDADAIAPHRGTGGVRLEDVFFVTADGFVNLTTCPRTVEEVNGVLAGGVWPPAQDTVPRMGRKWGTLDSKTGKMTTITLGQAAEL